MSGIKVHSIKTAEKLAAIKLLGHKNILIIGPMDLEQKAVNDVMKKLRPTAVVFVDGGIIHKKKLKADNKILSFSAGDGDSAGKNLNLDIFLPSEKDLSDLAFVLNCLKKNLPKKLMLLGFSGKNDRRLDHFLFNIGEIAHFVSSSKIQVQLDQFVFLPPGKHQLNLSGLFSLFTLVKTSVKLTGKVRYPLMTPTPLRPLSSLGLSNKASGKVLIESKRTVVLYLAGKKVI